MNQGGFGSDPFGGAPFGHNPFGAPPPTTADPPPQRQEHNTPATLSIVFAFVFAPAGAVLGHLGLGRARRAGGRDRALIGLTLSYSVIVVAVVALATWAVTGQREPAATTVATPNATAAPLPARVPSSTTTTTPPPPPRVEPAALESLVLPLNEIQAITNNPALAPEATYTDVTMPPPDRSRIDPVECIGSLFGGATMVYQGSGYRGFYAVTEADPPVSTHVAQNVAVFDDAAAAQRALAGYVQRWRDCAGTRLKWTWVADGSTTMFTLGSPQPAAGPMTVMTDTNDGSATVMTRALAAKANVLLDIQILASGQADEIQTIIQRILAKIPS